VAALKARLKDFEKTETLLKEKLKEEHAQLLNFQKKLSQAGSHLKSLAQENANLTSSLAQQKTDLEAVRTEQVTALQDEISKTKQGHQKDIKQLVDIIETTIDSTEGDAPDVSTSTLLDSYIKSVQKKLNTSATITKKDGKHSKITSINQKAQLFCQGIQKDLEQKIQDLQKEIKGILCILHIALSYILRCLIPL
jgi:chromosome segregation ATPase